MPLPPLTSRRVLMPAALILLLISSLLPARFNIYGPPIHNAVLVLLSPLTARLNALGVEIRGTPGDKPEGNIEEYHERILTLDGELRRMEAENRKLRRENAQLAGLKQRLSDDKYRFVFARVSGLSPDSSAHTFLIDQGARDGLEVGMIVVDGPYLVGRIAEVQHSTAAVRPINAPGNWLEVELRGEPNRHVVLEADAAGNLVVEEADIRIRASRGDEARLVDQRGTNPWPDEAQFLLIGQVAQTQDDPDNPLFQRIVVQPGRVPPYVRDVTVVVPIRAGAGRGGGGGS